MNEQIKELIEKMMDSGVIVNEEWMSALKVFIFVHYSAMLLKTTIISVSFVIPVTIIAKLMRRV